MITRYDTMISIENLFFAWRQFRRGKRHRLDVQYFERHLETHIYQLHEDLHNRRYVHGPYDQFYVYEPKQRHISKASIRDRLIHQLLYTVLNQIYEPLWIYHSMSSRIGKGTHKAVKNLQQMIRSISQNGTQSCIAWIIHQKNVI